jgi:hypothetical protein
VKSFLQHLHILVRLPLHNSVKQRVPNQSQRCRSEFLRRHCY